MKRCPQCQFVYEEEQAFCDMDGARLVHDTHALPPSGQLQTEPPRSAWKNPLLVVIPIVAITMLAFFALRPAATAPPVEPMPTAAQSEASQPPTDNSPNSNETPSREEASNQADENENRQKNAQKQAASSPTASRSGRPRSTATPRNQPVTTKRREEKNENRLGSIFNKTKRIIKKPFKF